MLAVIYNLGQNCLENCILGKHFSKHRSCTGSSLFPFSWKQCCCVVKRKPDHWAFVGSNIDLRKGVFFSQRWLVLEIVLLHRKVDMMGNLPSSFVRDCRRAGITSWTLRYLSSFVLRTLFKCTSVCHSDSSCEVNLWYIPVVGLVQGISLLQEFP